jgi:hypothetical protein
MDHQEMVAQAVVVVETQQLLELELLAKETMAVIVELDLEAAEAVAQAQLEMLAVVGEAELVVLVQHLLSQGPL